MLTPKKRRVGRNTGGLLTVADIARESGVHPSTVYRWIQSGDLISREVNGVIVVSRAAFDKFRRAFLPPFELRNGGLEIGRPGLCIDHHGIEAGMTKELSDRGEVNTSVHHLAGAIVAEATICEEQLQIDQDDRGTWRYKH